jgi:hypothetical protein
MLPAGVWGVPNSSVFAVPLRCRRNLWPSCHDCAPLSPRDGHVTACGEVPRHDSREEVQQDAAGGLGISAELPQYPSSAKEGWAMMRGVQSASGGLRGFWRPPRITGKLRFAHATHRGVQRGEAPLHFFYPPRMGARGLTVRLWIPACAGMTGWWRVGDDVPPQHSQITDQRMSWDRSWSAWSKLWPDPSSAGRPPASRIPTSPPRALGNRACPRSPSSAPCLPVARRYH